MSAAEKIAEKYFDEASQLAPVEVASAFALGVCLVSGPSDRSAWLYWLTQDYRTSWYFLDVIVAQKIWVLVSILMLSVLGPVTVNATIRVLLRTAAPTLDDLMRETYKAARELVQQGSRAAGDLQVAADWKLRRAKRLSRTMRAASFAASLTLISVCVLMAKHSWPDVFFALFWLAAYALSAWSAFQLFINTYLADQILLDASLGLPRSKLTGWEGDR